MRTALPTAIRLELISGGLRKVFKARRGLTLHEVRFVVILDELPAERHLSIDEVCFESLRRVVVDSFLRIVIRLALDFFIVLRLAHLLVDEGKLGDLRGDGQTLTLLSLGLTS